MQRDSLSAKLMDEIDRDGYSIVQRVFPLRDIDGWLERIGSLLASDTTESVLRHGGRAYASRNLLEVWPEAIEIARATPLCQLIESVLGKRCGLVRGLLFDKPPDNTWSLPWHQDMTIAVRDNRLPTQHFSKPTTKAGVAHVEAPQWLLEQMLTARIHLDDVTDENGPLQVIAGSHRWGKALAFDSDAAGRPAVKTSVLAAAGDVLLMRPLIAHSSPASKPATRRHRRIIHLEFAATRELPDGFAWRWYAPLEVRN